MPFSFAIALRNTNATTHKHQTYNKQNTNTIITQFQEDAYFSAGAAAISLHLQKENK